MSESAAEKNSRDDILRMAVEVVAAYVGNNAVQATQIPDLIHTIYNSLSQADGQIQEVKAEAPKASAPVQTSQGELFF